MLVLVMVALGLPHLFLALLLYMLAVAVVGRLQAMVGAQDLVG